MRRQEDIRVEIALVVVNGGTNNEIDLRGVLSRIGQNKILKFIMRQRAIAIVNGDEHPPIELPFEMSFCFFSLLSQRLFLKMP